MKIILLDVKIVKGPLNHLNVKINRLEDFNKELKLDFDRKVELFKLKEYNWKMDNETYLKLETENRTLKTMVLENKTEIK
jgi:hypothetical protein